MIYPLTMLAQDGDGIGPIIYGLIFFIIWIVSAIASAVGKWQQQKRKRERLAEMMRRQGDGGQTQPRPAPRSQTEPRPAPRPHPPRPAPQPAPPPVPPPPPLPKPSRAARSQPQVQRPKTSRRQPQPASVIAATEARAMAAKPAAARRGAAIAENIFPDLRAQLNPRSMRMQIALMEILKPPIALRGEDDQIG